MPGSCVYQRHKEERANFDLWFYHYGSSRKQAPQSDKTVICGSRRMHLTMDALTNLDI
jgi:hypothetical protein